MTGQKLRLFREFRNYSQEYIAEKLGITQNTYSRIENNQTKITAERLSKLATILNIPPLELLSEKEPVIHFSESGSYPPGQVREDHWKEMMENTRQLYSQVIGSKDEKIAHLENEISSLRREKDRFIYLLEKLTGATPMIQAVS
ncbi:MAG TPA: helix-turn-helix transcriptional regulator [Puia sp.]|jgi:transcriptional regulator with XRE-family HTH domain